MRGLLPFVLALGLTGCATGYQSQGFSGGFSEMQMAQDVYRITFRGNAFTNGDAASEMAMLRAAQITLSSGYSHFAVMGANDSVSTSYYSQPGTTTTTVQPNGIGGYNAWSNTSPGFVTPINKPRAEIIIRMFHDGSSGGLDAQQVYDRLAARYIKAG